MSVVYHPVTLYITLLLAQLLRVTRVIDSSITASHDRSSIRPSSTGRIYCWCLIKPSVAAPPLSRQSLETTTIVVIQTFQRTGITCIFLTDSRAWPPNIPCI